MAGMSEATCSPLDLFGIFCDRHDVMCAVVQAMFAEKWLRRPERPGEFSEQGEKAYFL